MKTFTKVSLFMLAMVMSASFMFAQNMTQEELRFNQELVMQKNAALGPVTYATPGSRAMGDDCTDPFSYGNINGPAQTGSIVSYGEKWYSFTGSEDMTVTVSLCGSDYDTKLEVWYDCADADYAFYNDDACGSRSEISGIPFIGGSTYYAKVYGFSSNSGNYELIITGVLPPPPLDPISVFPFTEDFETGSFPSTIYPDAAAQSDITVDAYAAASGNYGAMFEGGASTGWTSASTVAAAFANTTHVAKLEMEVVPTGESGILSMNFDFTQRYSFSAPYDWFQVLVNGTPIADVNGNLYFQASSNVNDPWQTLEYDLSAYQGLASFDLTLENAGKYNFGYYNDGDLACVDNFELYYLTIGNVEGYVYSPDGLPMPNATVGIEDLMMTTTTDATGYYNLVDIPSGPVDVTAWKEGYNAVVGTAVILPAVTVQLDITLTQPSITINPLFFDETLNPNEYLTKYIGLLNTGSGPGEWSAVINYLAKSYPENTVIKEGPRVNTDKTVDASPIERVIDNGSQSRDTWDLQFTFSDQATGEAGCESDGEYIYTALWSGSDYLKYDIAGNLLETFQVPGTSGVRDLAYDGEYMYGAAASTTVYVMDFTTQSLITQFTAPTAVRAIAYDSDLDAFYGNNWSTDITLFNTTGANLGSFACGAHGSYYGFAYDSWTEGGPYLWGYSQDGDVLVQMQLPAGTETGFTFDPSVSGASDIAGGLYTTPGLVEGTVTIGGNAQNDLLWGFELAVGGVTGGWLSLGEYMGTVPGNGASQNVDVNFDASGTSPGEIYQAEIVLETNPNVGIFTIPVTMTIFGDPLASVSNLEVELVSMVTGQVDLTWEFTSDVTFQYFLIKRNGLAVGTATETYYTDMLPDFGSYCYTVTPVFDEGYGGPAGPECVDWLIPALCWDPVSLYNEQWPDSQEDVVVTLENCNDGVLEFMFPDYVSGSRFSCENQVVLYDSYGDGWNGGTLDVLVNGVVVLDDITIASGAGPEYFSFPVEGGDDISTVYVAGSWSSENSYEILDADGNILASLGNVSLAAGTVYGTCPQPSYIINVEPAMGQIPAGATLDVVLTYDATGFPVGIWDEYLKIESNDPLRQLDSILNQMEIYMPGQFYGNVTDCNTGLGMEGVTVMAVGDLGGVYETTTNGTGYYEMYVDADTYDVGFELLGFESAYVMDTMAIESVMTEVSVTMCETPYPVRWVYADPNEADTECLVTWTLPMGPYEIIYDNGDANEYVVWNEPGGAVGVKFTPAGYPAKVTGGKIYVGDGSFPAGAAFLGTSMAVGVMDDDGVNGMPSTVLDSIVITVDNYGWVDFSGSFENVEFAEGEFYIVMWQLGWATSSAPVGVDTELPTTYRSVAMLPGYDWSMSPYQDFMIRAVVDGPNAGVVSSSVGQSVRLPKITEGPFLATSKPLCIPGTVKDGEFRPVQVENTSRDLSNYTIARVSNFDPTMGPETGTHTPIANPTAESYNDGAFGGQAPGFYAYAVKAVYESNMSEWVYSNTVAHLLDNEFTVEVTLCDGNDPDNADVWLYGQNFPEQELHGVTDIDGIVVFDSVIDGIYDLFVQKVGYSVYEHYNLAIYDDMVYSLTLKEKAYKPRNLYVDPLTSVATWDEPLKTALFMETFEEDVFPPEGWQSVTLDIGWRRTDNGSSSGWTIPAGDGFYAMENDDADGSVSDGSMDYLITPELDLRESDGFALYFSSFYDGTYGESAYVEFSYDAGATWEVMEMLSPAGEWTEIELDLSGFSGLESNPIWIAFHADDNGEWASGWCVDNVVVQNGPSPILGYHVILNDAFVAQTDVETRTYTFSDLAYGETYTAQVRALYACGLSDPISYTWTSSYLHPPRNIMDEYIYGTNEVPLYWNPPMTGTIPMAAAFNVVYVGPQTKSYGHQVDAASQITVVEYDNVENTRDYGDLQFQFPDADASGEAGAESDGEFIYTALWNGDSYIKYDLEGNMIESFTISGTSGVRDLAYDGEFMYGAAASTTVFVMDFTTQTMVSSFTAPTDVRAIAYNHDDESFYGNNWGTDIVNFDATGANLGSFTPSVTSIYGMAYDSWTDDGPYLWVYDQGANDCHQFSLPDGIPTGVVLDVATIVGNSELAGGLFTQPGLYSDNTVTIGGNIQNEVVWGIELAPFSGPGPNPGQVPDGLISFNMYRDGVNIANIPYEDQGTEDWVEYVDNMLMPGEYAYDVSAVYDLTIFGFAGQTAESAWNGTVIVNVVWGHELPFFEGWDNGTFEFQGWAFNQNAENWMINSQYGNPAPTAEFTWDPLLEDDYSSALESNPILADMLTEGDIYLDFEVALDDRNVTSEEKLLVEVYDGAAWNQVAEFMNDGSFDYTASHINITNYAMGRVFQVRFNAVGMNSFDIVSWFVDNISIYRECEAPTDLVGTEVWDGTAAQDVAHICWEAPEVPVPISEWIHWDDIANAGVNGIGLTGGGAFSVAARWDAGQLSDYAGTSITKVQYIVGDGATALVVKLWTGANAGTLIWEKDVLATSIPGVWNEVVLDTPIALPVNEEIWVGYSVNGPDGAFPALGDTGPAVAGYGDMISTDGSAWDPLSGFGFDYNWDVQFYVTETSASSTGTPMIDNTVYDAPNASLSHAVVNDSPVAPMATTSRVINGFNIYRMDENASEYELYEFVEYVDGQTSYCYDDYDVDYVMGYYYKVTATYESDTDACESPAAMAYEIPMDDFVFVIITGVENADALSTNLFPNPAQDQVTVTSSTEMSKITVTNYVGQVVYTSEVNATTVKLNTSSYQSGVYLVKIDTENGVVTKRVVISK